MPAWVILGCGYTGERLAARLGERGEPVIATVRRTEAAAALAARLASWRVETRVADAEQAETLAGWIPAGAVLVDSVPPSPPRPTHVPVVAAALRAAGGARYVYLSTTGVYARGDGDWVDEETPLAPEGERGRARVEAEQALLAAADAPGAGFDAVALRIAAIYGPGRGVAERLRAGSYRVPGDGSNWVSRVHVEDLVTAIIAAGEAPAPLARPVYVVADDEPCRAREHADAIAARLSLPPPPSVPLAELSPLAAELAGSNRRVRNTRLKQELGVRLRYPSFRDAPLC